MGFGFLRSVGEVCFGSEAGGVIGSFGENGDGGTVRLDDLNGAGVIFRCCDMFPSWYVRSLGANI